MNLFYGIGPQAGIRQLDSDQRTLDERTQIRHSPDSTTSSTSIVNSRSNTKTGSWNVGFGGVLGVEWSVSRRISLLAEYGSSFRFTRTTTERESSSARPGSTTTTDTFSEDVRNGFSFGSGAVKFGVSAYF